MHQGSKSKSNKRTEVLRSHIARSFGSRIFNPRPSGFTPEQGQGGKGQRSILTDEGDEMRGGKAGDRHRRLLLSRGRVSGRLPVSRSSLLLAFPKRIAGIMLQRNIDVFIPLDPSDGKTKL